MPIHTVLGELDPAELGPTSMHEHVFADLRLWAKTGDDKSDKSIRGFIVPTDSPGFKAKDQKGKLSLRASDTSEMVLQDVRVGADCLLPKSGGIKSPLMCLTQARYGIAWGAMGAAQACYEEALAYAGNRVMFGKPIAAFQLRKPSRCTQL